MSPELKGKMHIVVSADGKARVAKFFISRPNIVRVREMDHDVGIRREEGRAGGRWR